MNNAHDAYLFTDIWLLEYLRIFLQFCKRIVFLGVFELLKASYIYIYIAVLFENVVAMGAYRKTHCNDILFTYFFRSKQYRKCSCEKNPVAFG